MSAEPSEMQQFEALLDALIDHSETLGAQFFTGERKKLESYKAESKGIVMSFVASLAKDKARVDFMQEHGASVDVSDNETLSCAVQSSEDFAVSGSSATYNIRAAIDAAMTGGEKS